MFSVVLLSGGSGSRMEKSIPKQFLMLAGKPIIMHSIERLDQIEGIQEIVIVCHKDYIELVKSYLDSYMIKTRCKVIPGGATRQESTYIGLQEATYESVIVHEAARPFVKKCEFDQLILDKHQNAIFGAAIPFTVLKGTDHITELLERKELVNVQLPQKFQRTPLLKAHQKAVEDNLGFTEDASLLFYYEKVNIGIIPGSIYNLKITEPVDLITGEVIYKEYIIGRD